ncbi:MAG: DHH family phosphoesterase [Clostridia bacterium]|nr:DHH family phosphoesterase [Clostridia bacterium]
MSPMKTPEPVLRALSDAGSALLCAHIGPDGDTLGSTLALCAALEALAKTVHLTCADPVPALYAYMPGSARIVAPDTLAAERFDLAVAVDVSDGDRLGAARPLFDAAPVRVVIDHHATNDCFGGVNWIEPQAAATGMMVLACIRDLGVPLTREMAEYLYAAISTDTGNFRFSNTDAAVLRAAAALVDAGAQPDKLTEQLFYTRSRAGVQLRGRALSTLRLFAGGRAAVMTLTAQDFADTGAADSMTEGIVNYAIEIVGVEAAALARELDGEIKCSLRAREPYDAAALAQRFGGGGHARAAGCSLPLPMDCALRTLQGAMEELVG